MERFESSRHAYSAKRSFARTGELSEFALYGESYLHLQFTPKYRRELFTLELLQKACKAQFSEIAAQLRVRLEACDFGPNHVHIFVGGWKNFSIPQLAQQFKGASSHEMRREFGFVLVEFKLGDSLWSDGYFYETCGSVTAKARRYYIERMQKKHWI